MASVGYRWVWVRLTRAQIDSLVLVADSLTGCPTAFRFRLAGRDHRAAFQAAIEELRATAHAENEPPLTR